MSITAPVVVINHFVEMFVVHCIYIYADIIIDDDDICITKRKIKKRRVLRAEFISNRFITDDESISHGP